MKALVPLTCFFERWAVVDELPLLTLLVRHGEHPAHDRGAAFVGRLAVVALLVWSPALDQLGDDFKEKPHPDGPGKLGIFELRQNLAGVL